MISWFVEVVKLEEVINETLIIKSISKNRDTRLNITIRPTVNLYPPGKYNSQSVRMDKKRQKYV